MLYDFVILMPGNSYFTCINDSQIEEMNELIETSTKTRGNLIKLKDGNREAKIRSDAVHGWYFKPHEKSAAEKMLDLVKKQVEPPEDDWKNPKE